MKKSVLCILLVLAMMCSVNVFAENAVKSVTASEIILPSGVEVTAPIVVYLPPIEEETLEKEVFDEIVAFVQEQAAPVVEYFPVETIAAVVEKLPETVVAENLTLDEFFPLREVGYEEHYGEVEAVFEFAVSYKDDDVVIALVGVPADGEEVILEKGGFIDEKGILWIPMDTRIEGGKICVKFTDEAMAGVKAGKAMLALLRADEV